ncbi:Hypothetical protein PBC10988_1630 [Planctomycetales bacterium 10988]|nr:Hypothetical protein PBC10988_1630 [Planctomycetales bacterium 10988]
MGMGPGISAEISPAQGSRTQEVVDRELITAQIKAIAREVVTKLTQAEKLTEDWSNQGLTEILIDQILSNCLLELDDLGIQGPAIESLSPILWEAAQSWFNVGRLQHRARFKPRGMAGDYLLFSQICTQTVDEHPLGGALDRFFLRQAAPLAVYSRTQQTAFSLVDYALSVPGDQKIKVVSVGSGPAWDSFWALEALPESVRERMEFVLLDLDPEAVQSAKELLELMIKPGQITALRENLFRLAKKKSSIELLSDSDFISCLGLFDYLQDEPAAQMIRLFFQSLKPNGQLFVGNFGAHCPSRAFMEWIGNWYLIYRTPVEMHFLAEKAGIPAGKWQVAADRTGVNLMLQATRKISTTIPAPHFLRTAHRNASQAIKE